MNQSLVSGLKHTSVLARNEPLIRDLRCEYSNHWWAALYLNFLNYSYTERVVNFQKIKIGLIFDCRYLGLENAFPLPVSSKTIIFAEIAA